MQAFLNDEFSETRQDLPPPDIVPLPRAVPQAAVLDLFFQLDEQNQHIVEDWFRRQRQCVRCDRLYFEYQNTGTWRCRQHAGVLREDEERFGVFQWSCCQAAHDSPVERWGCVEADHSESAMCWTNADDRHLKLMLLKYIKVPEHALVYRDQPNVGYEPQPDDQDYVQVRRYNWRAHLHTIMHGPKPRRPYVTVHGRHYAPELMRLY